MAGLVPAIHVFTSPQSQTWMRGTSPRMTTLCKRGEVKISLHEFIRVELIERRLLGDDALRQIEVLQFREPFRIDCAEHRRARLD